MVSAVWVLLHWRGEMQIHIWYVRYVVGSITGRVKSLNTQPKGEKANIQWLAVIIMNK
jgi:hypothetical protein